MTDGVLARSRRSSLGVLAGAALGLLCLAGTALAAPRISVSPSSIAWSSNVWVNVTVSNLVAGAEVRLGLYQDVRGNGVWDTGDQLIASFLLKDGKTNWLGSSVIVDDEDGAANGTLRSRVAYFGRERVQNVSGNYLWLAKVVSDGATTVARFSVTQSTSAVWIGGTVVNSVTLSPVPGAVVGVDTFTDAEDDVPAVWTASDGTFRIYLPAGVSSADVSAVGAYGFGYSGFGAGGDDLSGYVFTNDLHAGENTLPGPLRLTPPAAGGPFEVLGHVYTPQTNAVPGVVVEVEWWDDVRNEEYWAMAVTDADGLYRFCLPRIEETDLYASAASLMHVGLVAIGSEFSITGNTANLDLFCPPATLLASGTVVADADGAPLAGATVFIGGDTFGSQGVSLEDGSFDVGVFACHDCTVEAEGGMPALGFLPAAIEGLSITDNTVTNLELRLPRGYPVTGTVYDERTNRVSAGRVGAFRYANDRKFWEWEVDTEVNRHGDFRLLAPTGELVVVVVGVPGCVGVVYRDYQYGEWDNNHVADTVLNAAPGASGVDFYLSLFAHIQGVVRGNGNPLPGIFVMASEVTDDGWEWRDGKDTDENGFYSLDVAPGSNYVVSAWVNDVGEHWLEQTYDHVADPGDATRIATYVDAPATNIDFDLEPGAVISGWVFESNGITPVAWCGIEVEAVDGSFDTDGETYEDGYYEVVVPNGEYIVRADGGRASYGVSMYYEGRFPNERHLATVVTARVGRVAGDINFIMIPGGTISGRVTEEDGFTPVPWCGIEALMEGEQMGDGRTEEDGYYSFRVPPGTYVVAARPDWDDRPFGRQYYSNATSQAEAQEITVTSGDEVGDIDFRLGEGITISGRVFREDGTTPLVNCHVFATDYDSNDWMDGDETDTAGRYTLRVPPGAYRVRAYPADNRLLYESRFYDDTHYYNDATPVAVDDTNSAEDVDFVLQPAGTISGHIYVGNGSTPLANCHIGAEEYMTGEWMAWEDTATDGSYRLVLPPGYYRVLARPSVGRFPYMDFYYEDTPSWQEVTLVQVIGTNDRPGIDFHLEVGGVISGHVYKDDGVSPIGDCHVYASDYSSGTWMGGQNTDASGRYAMRVPRGRSYRLSAVPRNTGLPYADEFYRYTTDWSAAIPVIVPTENEVGGIDFNVMLNDLNRTSWNGHHFSMEEMADEDIGGDNADPDGDGADNLSEYNADTDPRSSNSVLQVTGSRLGGGGLRIEWKGGRWAQQYLERSAALDIPGGGWTPVRDFENLPTVRSNVVVDTDATGPASFYRIRVRRQGNGK